MNWIESRPFHVIVCDETAFMDNDTILAAITPDIVPTNGTIRIGAPCDECLTKQILCGHEESEDDGTSRRSKRSLYTKLYEGREKRRTDSEIQGEVGKVDPPSEKAEHQKSDLPNVSAIEPPCNKN